MVAKSKRGKSVESTNNVHSKGDYVLVFDEAEENLFTIARVDYL